MLIRQATIKDVETVYWLNKEILPVNYPLSTWIHFINNSNYLVLIAIVDNKIVGYISGNYSGLENSFYINSFGVLPKYQNKKIGKNLLNELQNFLLTNTSIRKLTLHTNVHWKNTIIFYLKNDFIIQETIQNYYFDNQNAIFMVKNL